MIHYTERKHWKYKLASDFTYATGITGKPTDWQYLSMDAEGNLTIRNGYCWDGPSGPARDTENAMKGSLVHDALYQMISEGRLSGDDRKRCDEILREVCIASGMSKARAQAFYRAVRLAGGNYVKSQLLTAP